MHKQQAYGTWPSPITATMLTTAGMRLGAVAFEGDTAFWAEARPEDNGRATIVKALPGEAPVDVTSAAFNPRTRVHEYGGGSWWVNAQYLYFIHWDDQRLYRVNHTDVRDNTPVPLTPAPANAQALRYADGCVSPDGNWIVCVRESHDDTAAQPETDIVAIHHVATDLIAPETVTTEKNQQEHAYTIMVLASGADFYSTPRFSPDGKHMSWVQWSHPQMPWDGTELMLATVLNEQTEQTEQTDMSLDNIQSIAGNTEISVMGALWTRDGDLAYASDETGWWNLYCFSVGTQQTTQLTFFTDREVGTPAWIFGTQRFVELTGVESNDNGNDNGSDAIGACFALIVTHQARDQLHILKPDGHLAQMPTSLVSISSIAADEQGKLLVQGQSEDQPASIQLFDCRLAGESAQAQQVLVRLAEALSIDAGWLSSPKPITFASGDHHAHAFFYPPAAPDIQGLADELPPLIVMGHGGPTSHATAGLKLAIQFWTSRGIAVVDVNYGGSSGFGRDYRRLLNGMWGIVDVQDSFS